MISLTYRVRLNRAAKTFLLNCFQCDLNQSRLGNQKSFSKNALKINQLNGKPSNEPNYEAVSINKMNAVTLDFMQFLNNKLNGPNRESFIKSPLGTLLAECNTVKENLKALNDLTKDEKLNEPEVENERNQYLDSIKLIQNKILDLTVPINMYEGCNVILEVTPGVGGTEAKLFAADLFQMYLKYCLYKNWNIVGEEVDTSELGGLNSGTLTISGESIFKNLIVEGGIHRVQRVPETEKFGRLHTSTAKVLVIPQFIDAEIVLKDSDLRFIYTRSSGPGGQNVNKNDTCVKVVHKPTGIMVEDQTERFQHMNKERALKKLKRILSERQMTVTKKLENNMKLSQVETLDRSQKIRTYNFQKNRIVDHRIKYTVNDINSFMGGEKALDELLQHLVSYEMIKKRYNLMLSTMRKNDCEELFRNP